MSASGSDPIFFQSTASVLGLEACEVLCEPFKTKVFVSYNPPALPYASPTALQSQMLLVQNLQPRKPDVEIRHSLLQENL